MHADGRILFEACFARLIRRVIWREQSWVICKHKHHAPMMGLERFVGCEVL